jgi:AcrR family transcriptional regulator
MAMAARKSRKLAMAETREALILAGLTEFAEHGLDAPSLDKICARAGFTRGAFYVHFKNREDFIVAVMEWRLGAFFDAVIGTGDTEMGLEPTVRRFVDAILEMTHGAPALVPGVKVNASDATIQLHRLLEASERSPLIQDRLVGMLESAVQRVADVAGEEQAIHSMREDIDAKVVGSLMVALAIGVVTAVEAGLSFDSRRVGDAVIALLRGR